ncbi:RluA family pseudouridine synthase [Wolbachia endosymbiont of Brugia malayi]|uniref:RluA family pseudouridine synthase n=1 Tax=Wolbachia endosymbiont of Brugia malayi TaxID=80849 RepID=UPI00004C92DE|nr:RluA family pseudouridine synthase [Wolbachia endosymbiont of Brugia malayi]AAW70797.1 Pseudouridylate synthases, 23S RNA-specific [Wolbachia endosymbiont strain TRS of Brugia malayi]QCB61768.1 RluA family pseudouridine synthase [Wolbachia endosymbiont of Brugia malayi]
MGNIKTISVKDNNVRLDRYIRRIFPNLKQSVIEKSLRRGLIKVNDCKAKSSDRVNSGQIITIKYLDYIENANSDCKHNEKLVELLRSNILYEDEYILAINKPAGVIVQGGIKVKISISDLLDQVREGETFKIVHRLDRDTSGAIIFARNANVARYLMEEFKGRRVKKTYLALTSGIPSKNRGVIDYPLVKKYVSGQEKVVIDKNSPQDATTRFSIIAKFKLNKPLVQRPIIQVADTQLYEHCNLSLSRVCHLSSLSSCYSSALLCHLSAPILVSSKTDHKQAHYTTFSIKKLDSSIMCRNDTRSVAYLKLQPITGRTHQLRTHLAYINCPILGDGKYGGKKAFVDGIASKIHLHSYSLSLKLPNNKKITITAPLPEHIKKSIEALHTPF